MSIKNIFYKIFFVLIGIILGVGGTFIYIQRYGIPSENILQKVSQAEENKKIEEIVEKVGKLMLLPTGEIPAIATITDADTLSKEQVFYSGSENGDILLVYKKALKAIIYRPVQNVIINVGPVNVEAE
jgi:heme/copper-type cytochrome/quinol oxidase subunit 2